MRAARSGICGGLEWFKSVLCDAPQSTRLLRGIELLEKVCYCMRTGAGQCLHSLKKSSNIRQGPMSRLRVSDRLSPAMEAADSKVIDAECHVDPVAGRSATTTMRLMNP